MYITIEYTGLICFFSACLQTSRSQSRPLLETNLHSRDITLFHCTLLDVTFYSYLKYFYLVKIKAFVKPIQFLLNEFKLLHNYNNRVNDILMLNNGNLI